jgi:hypothetical protein
MTAEPVPTHVGVERLPFPLQENERVIALQRRHWWFLWPRTFLFVLLAFVPLIAAWIIVDLIGVRDELGIFWWIAIALWLVYWCIRAFFNWYQYHHDIWLVTNQRLIDSLKPHPFSLRVNTADLVSVQDISVRKSGITPTILNYGDVVCETAGSGAPEFIIGGVPHPESLQLLIDRERDRERGRIRGAETV